MDPAAERVIRNVNRHCMQYNRMRAIARDTGLGIEFVGCHPSIAFRLHGGGPNTLLAFMLRYQNDPIIKELTNHVKKTDI